MKERGENRKRGERRNRGRESEERGGAEFTKILLLQATQKRLLLALASSPDEDLLLHF